jgi:hypothetical protein
MVSVAGRKPRTKPAPRRRPQQLVGAAGVHRPGTGAWAGWGVTLYLLGFALATQVAQIHAQHA